MRPEQSLETKLDAYTALSGDDGTAGKNRLRSWAAYATAAGSSLALATSAEAGIIYSGVQNLSVTANNAFPASDTFKINMDGHNFTGQIRRVTSSGNRIGIAELNGNSVLLNGSGLLKRLAFGKTISAGAGAFASTGALKYRRSLGGNNISQRGTWQVGRTGFAGVKFTEGTGNTHLGWIRLEWQSAQINGIDFPNTLTAIDWAYESDSNTAITAGAVPEPSSAMMALLASGAVGVLAWRSRKRQGAANAQASTEAVS